MSCEEYERGAVRLPSDEVAAAMHATLVRTVNAVRDAAHDAARRWREDRDDAPIDAPRDVSRAWRRGAELRTGGLLYWLLLDQVDGVLGRPVDEQEAAMDELFPFATSSTTTFDAGFATIRLRSRGRLSWWAEGNRIHDHLADHPVYRAMVAQLDKIEWTDGSGGASWRTDETQADDDWSPDAVWGDRDAPSRRQA